MLQFQLRLVAASATAILITSNPFKPGQSVICRQWSGGQDAHAPGAPAATWPTWWHGAIWYS